jgi:ribonucleotide reductase beta subunit family protein with ferritin-like domain
MATKVLVIITDDKVYSTYVETICFTQKYSNEAERQEAVLKARASAFSYACTFGSVYVDTITLQGSLTDQDIFKYLKTFKI